MKPEDQPEETSIVLTVDLLGYNKIEIVGHALEKMELREITSEEIIETIRAPARRGLPTQRGRFRYRKNRNLKTAIDVVFEKLTDRIRVITAIKTPRRMTK